MSKKPFKMGEMTIVKIIYAMVALKISGLTVGVVVAIFVSFMKLLEQIN